MRDVLLTYPRGSMQVGKDAHNRDTNRYRGTMSEKPISKVMEDDDVRTAALYLTDRQRVAATQSKRK